MTEVRPVKETDISEILEIYVPFISNTAITFENTKPDFEEFKARVMGIFEQYPFYVIAGDKEVLGYAYASRHREREAYRWIVETSVYIKSGSHGKGLGKLLYSKLLEELTLRQFTLAYGIITLPNPGSVTLHEKCGFTEMVVHKNAGWKLNSWHDVLWMKKTLNKPGSPPAEPVFKPGTFY